MDWQKYLMLAMQKGKLCTPWQPVYVLEASCGMQLGYHATQSKIDRIDGLAIPMAVLVVVVVAA